MYRYRRIRDTREDRDLTQKEIAEVLGMKYQQYARYENGEVEIPLHYLIKLSEFYGVSVDYLVSIREYK
ncbi:MAG: helix-turn-helix transcriptional regulator [Clostridia bacterium]|nr:helix-turn-helix transcriptional regulator [Clostridia bacterium]